MRFRLRERYLASILGLTAFIVFAVSGGLYVVHETLIREMRASSDAAMTSSLVAETRTNSASYAAYLASNLARPMYRMDIDSVRHLLTALLEQPGVELALVFDADGRVLHDGTDTLERYGEPVDPAIVAAIIDRQEFYETVAEDSVVASAPVTIGSKVLGGVVVEKSLDDAKASVAALEGVLSSIDRDGEKTYLAASTIIAALLFAVGFGLSHIVARNLTRPISMLSDATKRIGERNYEIDLSLRRQDEIGELAEALNRAASELRATTVSKAYFLNIVHRMLDPLFVTGQDGAIQMVNKAALRLLGFEESEVIGRTIGEVLRRKSPDGTDLGLAPNGAALIQGEEAELIDKTGRATPVLISASTMPNPAGGDSIICVARDISDRLDREKLLREAKEEADFANRTKTEFLANMSHELRTPLNAILGFSEMIAGKYFGPIGDDKYVEYANDINRSGNHLLQIINDILDLAKVEAGKMELAESEIKIAPMLCAVQRLVKDRAAEAGIVLDVVTPPDGLALKGDELRIRQVLLNLLSNAIKFTGAGGRIEIEAEADVASGLVMRVADTGVGIEPEQIPQVLSPFGQVESALVREHEGTGLGLPLCVRFMELHGGRLDLKSTPGEGTTVELWFPPFRVAQETEPVPAETA